MKNRKIKHKKKASGNITYGIIVGGIILLVLIARQAISPSNNNNILGTTTYLAHGDDQDEDSNGSSGSGSSRTSESSGSGSSDNGESSTDLETNTIRTETRDSTTGIRTQTEIKQDETRTEVRLSEEERIRTRTKDGETRIDITDGGIKTRLEYKNDRVIVKAEREDGTEVELEDDTIFKIDQRLNASGIKVATAGAEKFVIQKGLAGAITNFPLSIDLATNTLIVNTSSGQKNVAVLPDQAIQNLIAANVVSRIGGQKIVDAVRNNTLSSINQIITLGEQNGVPVYEINGISDQKLLGFIPISLDKNITVSVETGAVLSTTEPFLNKLVDLFAF